MSGSHDSLSLASLGQFPVGSPQSGEGVWVRGVYMDDCVCVRVLGLVAMVTQSYRFRARDLKP